MINHWVKRQPKRVGDYTLYRIADILIGIAIIFFLANAALAQAKAINILPLGDSITDARYGYASYRQPLYQKCKNAGYSVDFVGTLNGPSRRMTSYGDDFDRDHEGHWGWRVDQIIAKLPRWLDRYPVDIALIHLGTNDIFQSQPVTETIQEMGQLIEILRQKNPSMAILIAQLIPARMHEKEIREYNDLLDDLAQKHTTDESPIVIVDQFSGFDNQNDTFDGTHPNQSGEEKMAQKWFDALKLILEGVQQGNRFSNE